MYDLASFKYIFVECFILIERVHRTIFKANLSYILIFAVKALNINYFKTMSIIDRLNPSVNSKSFTRYKVLSITRSQSTLCGFNLPTEHFVVLTMSHRAFCGE